MEETHLPAAQRANHHPKTHIRVGAATPHDMLSEGEVATQLGVSRTPVREAFTRLQSEGWLRLYPRRGALVVPPDHEQARDLVTARIMLESAALEAATGRKPGEEEPDLSQLSTALDDIVDRQRAALESHDFSAFVRHDLTFHRAIVEAAHNSIFLRFHDLVADQEERMSMRSVRRSPTAAQRVLDQHRELVSAVHAGDVDTFRSALRRHLLDIHSGLLT
jgi:DNA-binding GntR family transcriptional regulator